MAEVLLIAAGAGTGWLAGGTLTMAAIGAAGGYLASTMMETSTQHIEGARLNDLKVQSSTYGQAIPLLYGTHRLAGNVIWAADFVEHAQQEGGGDKGGVTFTTRTYTCSFAVGLCAGAIKGVRRIWADSVLIYDKTPGRVSPGLEDSLSVKVYLGTETQMPDPTIQSHVGSDNTPAYRGLAYVVFTDFEITKHGNRIPNLTFEVAGAVEAMYPAYKNLVSSDYQFAIDGNSGFVWTARLDSSKGAGNWKALIEVFNPAKGYTPVMSRVLDMGVGWLVYSDTDLYRGHMFLVDNDKSWLGGRGPIKIINTTSGVVVNSIDIFTYADEFTRTDTSSGSRIISDGGRMLAVGFGGTSPHTRLIFDLRRQPIPYTTSQNLADYPNAIGMATGTIDAFVKLSGGITVIAGGFGSDKYLDIFRGGNFSRKTTVIVPAALAWGTGHSTFEHKNGHIYWANQGSNGLLKVSTLNGSVTRITQDASQNGYVFVKEAIGSLITLSYPDGKLERRNINTLSVTELIGEYPVPFGLPYKRSSPWYDRRNGMIVTSYLVYPVSSTINAGKIDLAGIIVDLCRRGGLSPAQVDVSSLSGVEVHGIVYSQAATVRGNLEVLSNAYLFDVVESGNVLKFVKRGAASVATLPTADLAAHHHGSAVPSVLDVNRLEETELPREINIQYSDIDLDYNPGAQYSRRLTGSSLNVRGIQLPLALSATEAKRLADALMFSVWSGRETVKFATTRKYAVLEPTDVVTITHNGITRRLKIIGKDESADGIIEFDTVTEAMDTFNQEADGVEANFISSTISFDTNTRAEFLDIPIINDAHVDSYGFYLAVCGYQPDWRGCVVYRSIDEGLTWQQLHSIDRTQASAIGNALDVLAVYQGSNTFDEISSVTVVLSDGELEGVSETLALGGSNLALVGDELIIFREAELIDEATYRLTGLLRGRFGTEHEMYSHAAGDRFVLLNAAKTLRIDTPASDIGKVQLYKVVSFGLALEDAEVHAFMNTAVGMKPYSVVQIGGGRNAAGDIIIKWVRRNRIDGAWRDSVDIPMSETAELYDVEIYADNTYATVVRTFSDLTAQTVTYTAANQSTDFGGNQSAVYAKIYQIGNTGRGFAGIGVI